MPACRLEPPSWVRVFRLQEWDEPDEQERSMAGGGRFPPGEWHDWHAQRRWHAAVNAWYKQHPEADHRLEELLEQVAYRRGLERRPASG
jgi:hypothetical protein